MHHGAMSAVCSGVLTRLTEISREIPPAAGVGVRHPHHADINDLSRGLHGDALQLPQTVLKLGRGVARLIRSWTLSECAMNEMAKSVSVPRHGKVLV